MDKRVDRILTWMAWCFVCVLAASAAFNNVYGFIDVIPGIILICFALYSLGRAFGYAERVNHIVKHSTEWQVVDDKKSDGYSEYEES